MTDITQLICPKRVTIETIYGCNASCIMCPIDLESSRKKGVMPLEISNKIFDELEPYREQIEMMDLFGLGEPLLDPHITARIRKAKRMGFRNLAISTNAELLKSDVQEELLESEIDTIIFSIDGIQAETYESIRRKLDFSKVMENCAAMIRRRNSGNCKTRFVVRFIRQDSNRAEWDEYVTYWSRLLSCERNDVIIRYDAHSWAGSVFCNNSQLQKMVRNPHIEIKPCWHVFEHLVILADGTVPLCSEDWHRATVNFGNVCTENPLDIFNNKKFQAVRKLHGLCLKTKIGLCSTCVVHYTSSSKKEVIPGYEIA